MVIKILLQTRILKHKNVKRRIKKITKRNKREKSHSYNSFTYSNNSVIILGAKVIQ